MVIGTSETEQADALFHALADPTRRDILSVVLRDAHSVSDLARRYPISFAAVHKHVGALERAGLVTKTRHGREQRVRGDVATLRTAHRLLDDLEALWRGRIDRIDAAPRDRRGGTAVTVISVVKDAHARTLTITARFDAPIDRVWQIWSDPRQLERWWGPPAYPATVTEHDLTPGGTVAYFMTGPDGERHRGWWRVRAVDPPHALEFESGVADADGNPSPDTPAGVIRVALSELAGGGTQMVITMACASDEAMEWMVASGMDAGMTAAVGQIDELLTTREGTNP